MKFSEVSERLNKIYDSWGKDHGYIYKEDDLFILSDIIDVYCGLTESSFFELDLEVMESEPTMIKANNSLKDLSEKYDSIAVLYNNDMSYSSKDIYDSIRLPRLDYLDPYSYKYLSNSEVEELGSLLSLLKEYRIGKDNYLWRSIIKENMNFIVSSYICLTSVKSGRVSYRTSLSPIPINLDKGVKLYYSSWFGNSIKDELSDTVFEILSEFKNEEIRNLVENRILLKNLEFDESNSEISMLVKLQDIL